MHRLINLTIGLIEIYRISIVVIGILLIAILIYAVYENKKIKTMNQDLIRRNERINHILYATKSGLWEWHHDTDKLIVDQSFKTLIKNENLDYDHLTFKAWKDLTVESDQALFEKELKKLYDINIDFIDFEYRMYDSNQKEQWIHCFSKVIKRSPNGMPITSAGIINNITLEKETTREKDHVNYLLEHFIENSNGGVAIFDKNMNYVYVSNLYKKQFNLEESPIGKNHYDLFPDLPEKFKKAHQRSLKGEVLGENRDTYLRSTGEKLYSSWSTRPWYDRNQKIGGIISYVQIITDQVLKEMKLEHVIKRDHLTGLFNRSFFSEEFSRLDREGKHPIGILMMDLNGLKLINDAYGFSDGDIVLKMVADQLSKCSLDCGELYRIGGDEFAFLSQYTDDETMKACVKKIHEVIEALSYNNITLSMSIGYALKMNQYENIEDILREAETNMYRRKVLDSTSIRNNAIQGILQTLTDKYDVEKTHSDRVQKLCIEMGEALELDKDDINELSYAAVLHDIGKIGIPDAILMKPAKLTEEEFEIMKTHTEKGYHILRAADGYSDLAKYALTHHEKFDGTGYPNGIKGKDIPFFSRIISICDAYEAMTADRPYRPAQPLKYAIDQLTKYADKQFDPELVNVFIEKVIPKTI